MIVLQHPDPLLKRKARRFEKADLPRLLQLLPELQALMRRPEARLVGIAMPQIGWDVAAFVFDPFCQVPRLFLNPHWNAARTTGSMPKMSSFEGCLSVAECRRKVSVDRWRYVRAHAEEVHRWWVPGRAEIRPFSSELADWEARVFQHETDHLDGVLLGGNPDGR
jgi:peptide deformylase